MWIHIICMRFPSIPVVYSKSYYLIIMIVHSCNNLILIFGKGSLSTDIPFPCQVILSIIDLETYNAPH